MRMQLLFRDEQGREGAVEIEAAPIAIGRASDCRVPAGDGPERYARVEASDGTAWIVDVSGLTLVNGVPVARQRLHHGDVMRCGGLWLRYVEIAEDRAISTAPAAFHRPIVAEHAPQGVTGAVIEFPTGPDASPPGHKS